MEANKVDERVEELKGEARAGAERVGNALNRVKENISHKAETAKHRAEEAYHRAQDAYGKVADTSIHDVQHNVEDFARSKPVKALLIAAGIGLVAGLLLRGRR